MDLLFMFAPRPKQPTGKTFAHVRPARKFLPTTRPKKARQQRSSKWHTGCLSSIAEIDTLYIKAKKTTGNT